MYWLVRRTEITRIMLISLVTPVAAVVIGAMVKKETLSRSSALGGACVLAGLGLVIYRRAAPVALENVEG